MSKKPRGRPGGARRRDGADDAAAGRDAGEQAEAGARERLRHVGDHQLVAQVRLVGPVFQHRFGEGDAAERRRIDLFAVREFPESALHHRLHRSKDIVLRDEAHLDVELVEHQRPVSASGLVAEAGGDLEVAVEPRDHAELLELLRRLRQGVELAGVQAGGNQEVAGALGAADRQDRGLELIEAAFDHAAADAVDDGGPRRIMFRCSFSRRRSRKR